MYMWKKYIFTTLLHNFFSIDNNILISKIYLDYIQILLNKYDFKDRTEIML